MANQDLLDYVRKSLGAGRAPDEIRRALVAQGWKEQDINEGLAAVSNVSSPVSPELNANGPVTAQLNNAPVVKKGKGKLFLLSIVVVMLLLGSGAIFIGTSLKLLTFLTFQPIQATSSPSSSHVSQESPAPSTALDAISADPSLAEATSSCAALFANKGALLYSMNFKAGDTDTSTKGTVSMLQKIIALDKANFPNFHITGTFDEDTQTAVTKFEQIASSTGIVNPKTIDVHSFDPNGTFGQYGQAVVKVHCVTLGVALYFLKQLPPVVTSQKFWIPDRNITVRIGETAISYDGNYSIRLNKATKSTDPKLGLALAADVTITAKGQTLEKTFNISTSDLSGLTTTVNGLTIRTNSILPMNENSVAFFNVSGPIVGPAPVSFQIPGTVTLTLGQRGISTYEHGTVIIDREASTTAQITSFNSSGTDTADLSPSKSVELGRIDIAAGQAKSDGSITYTFSKPSWAN